MKIAIIGYSGAGKSTLATRLGEAYACDVLHLDSVHFTQNWAERSDEDMCKDVRVFMAKENWVIDGNYSRILDQQRMEAADQIIILAFNRFACLRRAYKRYRKYKGTTRPDLAQGCNEQFKWEFIRWILKDGRSKKARNRYRTIEKTYPQKTIILKNQAQLDRFLRKEVQRP